MTPRSWPGHTNLLSLVRRQEAEAQQQCAHRLAGVIEWLDAQADAEGPFFLGKQVWGPHSESAIDWLNAGDGCHCQSHLRLGPHCACGIHRKLSTLH